MADASPRVPRRDHTATLPQWCPTWQDTRSPPRAAGRCHHRRTQRSAVTPCPNRHSRRTSRTARRARGFLRGLPTFRICPRTYTASRKRRCSGFGTRYVRSRSTAQRARGRASPGVAPRRCGLPFARASLPSSRACSWLLRRQSDATVTCEGGEFETDMIYARNPNMYLVAHLVAARPHLYARGPCAYFDLVRFATFLHGFSSSAAAATALMASKPLTTPYAMTST